MAETFVWWLVGGFLLFAWVAVGWIECQTDRSTHKRAGLNAFFYNLLIGPALLIFLVLFVVWGPRR